MPGRTVEVSFAPNHLWIHVKVAQTVLFRCETEVYIAFSLQYLHDTCEAADIASVFFL